MVGAPRPLDRTVEAGFTPTTHEFLQVHRHAHLDVFVNGKPVTVPPGIGIDITDPGVKTTPSDAATPTAASRSATTRASRRCTPTTTRGSSTPSPRSRGNTLGEFFTEWGVRLDAGCVGGYCKPEASIQVFVDGDRFEGDPGDDRARRPGGDRDRDRVTAGEHPDLVRLRTAVERERVPPAGPRGVGQGCREVDSRP